MKSLAEGLNDFYGQQADAGQELIVEGNRPWSRPLKSVALAVLPSQVKEATEDARKRGVPTDFTKDGRPIFNDRDHRSRYMKEYGYFDKDAGYGDVAPKNYKGKPPPSRLREIAKRLAAQIRVRYSSIGRHK